jgi:hypothetical protein
MGRLCDIRGRDEKMHAKFWSKNVKGRDHLGGQY